MRYTFAVRDIDTKGTILLFEYNGIPDTPEGSAKALRLLFDDIDAITSPYGFEYSRCRPFPKDGERARRFDRGEPWQTFPPGIHVEILDKLKRA